MLLSTSGTNGYLGVSLLDAAPAASEFTTLADHVSSTPASFSLETDPVLHYDLPESILKVLNGGLSLLPIPNSPSLVLDSAKAETEGFNCQAKVASSRLFLWFPDFGFGYSIPYPCITLHGIADSFSIYLQIAIGTGDDQEFVELYLVPSTASSQNSVTKDIYDALCTCADMHADPGNSSDDEGNGGIALDMDIDMGLEDINANGDDDGWTSHGGRSISLEGGEQENDAADEGNERGTAGLEIAIEDSTVRAGVRRRRSEDLDDTLESESNGNGNIPKDAEDHSEDGGAEKWRRTS